MEERIAPAQLRKLFPKAPHDATPTYLGVLPMSLSRGP